MKRMLRELTKSRQTPSATHGKAVVNDMNVKKKVVGVFAIVLAIAAISAITLPALAVSDNTGQGNETNPCTCDQTCNQDRARLRDGSCGDGFGAGSCDGSQKQYRYGFGTIGGSDQGVAQHRYGKGSS